MPEEINPQNLQPELTALKTEVEALKKENESLRYELAAEIEKQKVITMQKRYKENLGKARGLLATRVQIKAKGRTNVRLLKRAHEIIELLITNGAVKHTELRSRFKLSVPTISRYINLLRKAGLVKSTFRKRQGIVILTPAGELLGKEFERVVNE